MDIERLKTLKVEELESLNQAIDREKEDRRKSRTKEVRKELEQIIRDHGMTLADVFPALRTAGSASGGGPAPARRTSATPKYCNPKDRTQTWSGQGRFLPQWVRAIMDERNITIEQFKNDPLYRFQQG